MNKINLDEMIGENIESIGIAFTQSDHPLINNYKLQWKNKENFLSR